MDDATGSAGQGLCGTTWGNSLQAAWAGHASMASWMLADTFSSSMGLRPYWTGNGYLMARFEGFWRSGVLVAGTI